MKLKKIIKKVFKFTLITVVLLIGLAIAIPYFFKDDIIAKIKEEANASLNAKIDFGEVNLSLIQSFPNFSFGLENLKVVGIDQFEGVPLVSADNINFTLDLMSVIQSDRAIEIKNVNLDKPEVNILILRDGKANYDIAKPSDSPTEETNYNFLIQLQQYSINDGNVTYDDQLSNIFFELKNLNHQGKGDFTQDVFDLATQTSIEQLTAVSGGIPYLKKANTNLDATFNIDLNNNKYTLTENDLQVNEMKLLLDGFVQLEQEDINMDFTFNAPRNNFRNLLSLIPNAYTKDFSDVKTNGKMAIDGYVKGSYNGAKNKLPAFKVKLDVDQASFQYPDLPMGVDNINAKINIESPSSDFDKMEVDIPNFQFALNGEPFDGNFNLTSPISDPNIDTKLKGKIDLANLNKAFPMDGVEEISGVIDADIIAKASMSTLENGDYETANVSGKTIVTNLTYKAEGLPKVYIETSELDFSPQYADIKNFKGKVGKSDLEASGKIDNILAYFSPEKTMTGDLKIRSKYFNIDEWMGESESENQVASADPSASNDAEIFEQFKFNFDAKIGEVDYDTYELINSSATGSFAANELIINDFNTNIGKSDLSGKGSLNNVFNYVFKGETLKGNLAIESNFFDVNPFMEEAETAKPQNISELKNETYEPIVIPSNYDIDLNAKVKKLVYTNLDLKDFSGNLKVADSKVVMKDVSARTLGGKIVADGYYDTTNPEKPNYELTYDINHFNFKNSFEKFLTVKKLAPIAQYIEGNFSSKLTINGVLGENFVPDFNSLTADGFLQTADGFIRDFVPFQKIGEALNIKKLGENKINLKGTKNWFEVEKGKVIVKEFPLKYQGIDMKIGGSHGISQDINYLIKAKIPTKLIGKNPVGSAAKKGLDLLNQQASKLNINLDAGEFLNVNIRLNGSIKNPKISFDLVGSGGKTVKDVVVQKFEEAKDSVVTIVKEEIDDQKEKLEAKVQARKAALAREADKKIAGIKSIAENNANKIRREGKKAANKAREQGYQQADLLVEKAGNNPLKKRAAQVAARKLKKETDKQVQKIESEANQNADRIIKESENQSDKIRENYKKKMDKITVDNLG